MKRYYQCPVCGYNKMQEPPQSWNICPCCGTEFENDDDELSHSELRRQWVARGLSWFSKAQRPPKNWNAYQQLFDAGFGSEFIKYEPEAKATVNIVDDAVWRFPDLQDLLGAIKPASA